MGMGLGEPKVGIMPTGKKLLHLIPLKGARWKKKRNEIRVAERRCARRHRGSSRFKRKKVSFFGWGLKGLLVRGERKERT